MFAPRIGKTKNRADAFAVRGLDVTVRFEEELGRAANKFLSRFGEGARLGFFGEIVFVSDIANNHGHFVGARLDLDPDFAGDHPADLVLRQVIGVESLCEMRAGARREKDPAWGGEK